MPDNVEVLAPAGSIDTLYADIAMGADAVYVGMPKFSARAYAKNPSVSEIYDAITYAHMRGKKIYLTVNTLLDDREIYDELIPMLKPLYEAGLDACIVQDIGVMYALSEVYPDMALHASTQMALLYGDEAMRLKKFGVTRYVPARELSLSEIKKCISMTDMEIEVFVHGAMCICYSGCCHMSETAGGRSGNRGACAGPCRLYYMGDKKICSGYRLNAKDICTLFYIPDMVDAGISSFKIEGRMKKREYAAYNAYLYRKYTDIYINHGRVYYDDLVSDTESELYKDYKRSMELYNRGGFFSSFLIESGKADTIEKAVKGHCGRYVGTVTKVKNSTFFYKADDDLRYQDVVEIRDDTSASIYEYTLGNDIKKGDTVSARVTPGIRVHVGDSIYITRNNKLIDKIDDMINSSQIIIPLQMRFVAKVGDSAKLYIKSTSSDEFMIEGDIVERADKKPVDKNDIKKRLISLGGTGYVIDTIETDIDDDIFIPLGHIKKLRRKAILTLEEKSCIKRHVKNSIKRADIKNTDYPIEESQKVISVSDVYQLLAVLDHIKHIHTGDHDKSFTLHNTHDTVIRAHESIIICIRFGISDIYLWMETIKKIYDEMDMSGISFIYAPPRILCGSGREAWIKEVSENKRFFKFNWVGIVIESMASLTYRDKYHPDIKMYAGDDMYMMNTLSKSVYLSWGLIPLPHKIYGRTPVMVSAHHITDRDLENITSKNGTHYTVCDRPLYGYQQIYTDNGHILYEDMLTSGDMTDIKNTYDRSKFRIEFTTEGADEIHDILTRYEDII